MFPFGEEVGDKGIKMDVADGNSPYIIPPVEFPFLGKSYKRLYVSVSNITGLFVSSKTVLDHINYHLDS